MSGTATPTPRASVLVPTHDRARSLQLAVRSALAQSEPELEVIVIGDGLTPRARDAVDELLVEDPRVRLVDRPKSEHHGEQYRHDAIVAARSDAIFYLCDDDLLLPGHVASLCALLEAHDFVQSLNGHVDPEGNIGSYPGDLADPESVQALLDRNLGYNFVSLTGTAHRRSFYVECATPWELTPPGEYPDHHQWRRMLDRPGVRAATAGHLTALQFPTSSHGRDQWSEGRRLEELERWAAIVRSPDAQEVVDDLVVRGTRRQLARTTIERQQLRTERDGHHAEVEQLRAEHAVAEQLVRGLTASLAAARQERDTMRQTLSWRVTAPLRAVRRATRTRGGPQAG